VLVPLTARNFEVRDFQAADFDTLWRIDQECFPPGISYSRAELRLYLRRRRAFGLVAVSAAGQNTRKNPSSSSSISGGDGASNGSGGGVARNSGIAGFIVAEVERGAGHIITIDVVANARRHGVGSLLLGAAEMRLRGAGCRLVELETAVDNVSALSFYKRHEYMVVGTLSRYYSNGVDALVLQKAACGQVDQKGKPLH
jgi:[ribosomal protein S18]-alanine N-acetyltransferase